MIFYGSGTQRIFHRSAGFITGLTVTAYIWNTTLVQSALQTFTEISNGLYYLDYDFSALGDWPMITYETAVAKASDTIRIFPPTIGSGTGVTATEYTVIDDDGDPIAGAYVWVTSDIGGATMVASAITNTFGIATFYLNSGTYYMWSQKTGYDFTNPDTEVVA